MKRKLFLLLLSVVAALAAMLCMTACGDGEENGVNPETQYTVTFDANGGTFEGGESVITKKVNGGFKAEAPSAPQYSFAEFVGWSTQKTDGKIWEFSSAPVTRDITLYAVWREKPATLKSVDGATLDSENMSLFMFVEKDIKSVSLSNKVTCSADSAWKLYYDKLGQTEIPTKIAAGKTGVLSGGDNIFYIVVTSSNGSATNVYELNVHRSHAVAINFYHGTDLIKTDTVYTGNEYRVNFIPQIDGYDFELWKDENGEKVTSVTVFKEVSFYADCTVKSFKATLDVNGGEDISITEYDIIFGENYNFGVAERFGYTFDGWYAGNIQATDGRGESIGRWEFAKDTAFTAKWTALKYKVRVDNSLPAGGTVEGEGDYDYDSRATLKANTNYGYAWLGWFDEKGKEISAETEYTFIVETGVRIIAKWEISVPPLFEYEKEGSKYTITGINDKNVKVIQIPDYVTAIGNSAFSGCSYATELIIPDTVTEIGRSAFTDCTGLSKVTLPDNLLSLGNFAFHNGTEALRLEFNEYDNAYYIGSKSNPYMLLVEAKNFNITSCTIHKDTKFIYTDAFGDCTRLTGISIPNGVLKISNVAFYKCSSLKNVVIPSTVKIISDYAFGDCTSLTSINIPAGVSELGDSVFEGCTWLMNVTISESVISIGDDVFRGCSKLSVINYTGTIAQWRNIEFGWYWSNGMNNVTIKCKDGNA